MDSSELTEFLVTHRPALARLCTRWTRGHRSDADDLLGDASLKAVEALRGSPAPVKNPLAWWSTIISNLGRDQLRMRARRGMVTSADPLALEAIVDPHAAPESCIFGRDELARALSRLTELTAHQKEALLRRAIGEDYAMIASSLDTSAANARKLVQIARETLRVRREDERRAPSSAA